MKNKVAYTSVDTILAKFSRDVGTSEVNESDLIEWIGEALGFLSVAESLQEAVAFLEVKNHTTIVPLHMKYVVQVAKNNSWKKEEMSCKNVVEELTCDCKESNESSHSCNKCGSRNTFVLTDCQGQLLDDDYEIAYYRPFFDLQYQYFDWVYSNYYRNTFTPMSLSNHTFFSSVVCKDNFVDQHKIYSSSADEYSLVGDFPSMQIRTSFKEGQIALSYLKTATDSVTGYPLIPDDISHITAISYYIKWKLAERYRWSGREGFRLEAEDAEMKWLKYVRQANNKLKLPQGIDDYQDLMNESLYLLPRHNRYKNFFGNLGKPENRLYNKLR